MGFFDKIFTKETKKFISDMVDKAVDNVTGGNSSSANTSTNKSSGTSLNTSGNASQLGEPALRARLEQVISEEYSTYELRQNIPSSELSAGQGAVDYSYGIYKNGKPVAMINVITNRNDYRLKRFRMAKEAAVKMGVPHMNFFTHLPNEKSYISERLKKEIFG